MLYGKYDYADEWKAALELLYRNDREKRENFRKKKS